MIWLSLPATMEDEPQPQSQTPYSLEYELTKLQQDLRDHQSFLGRLKLEINEWKRTKGELEQEVRVMRMELDTSSSEVKLQLQDHERTHQEVDRGCLAWIECHDQYQRTMRPWGW